jgi:hypothetical protein
MNNEHLVELAREHTERYAPRTPERRAAAALYIALTTTKTPDAARRALATFGTPQTRADARGLLDQLEDHARQETGV